jgi:hypothetical protein
MRFRKYSYGRKSIDNFVNRIGKTFGKKIVIGYGSWSRETQMKNFMPTMGRGLRKEIHRRYPTVTVNESYTSKKCNVCYQDLVHHKDSNGKRLFRLLKCASCKNENDTFEQVRFLNRDENSATNILNLLKLWVTKRIRPKSFTKPVVPQPTNS